LKDLSGLYNIHYIDNLRIEGNISLTDEVANGLVNIIGEENIGTYLIEGNN
jgi:hypothetical protein